MLKVAGGRLWRLVEPRFTQLEYVRAKLTIRIKPSTSPT